MANQSDEDDFEIHDNSNSEDSDEEENNKQDDTNINHQQINPTKMTFIKGVVRRRSSGPLGLRADQASLSAGQDPAHTEQVKLSCLGRGLSSAWPRSSGA